MNKLIYILFLSVFFLDYLHFSLGLIPRSVTWMPEFLSMIAGVVIASRFAIRGRFKLHPKYLYLIFLYSTVLFVGTVLNATSSKVIIIGMRHYYKHLPFFLLPAVYDFSEKDVLRQLKLALFLLLMQCPLALYQRYIEFKDRTTGDVITGTLEDSGSLSITLICAIGVVFAFYLKRKINVAVFLVFALMLLVPTTINETKVSIILLPVAFLLPALLCEGYVNSGRVKNLLIVILMGSIFLSVFVVIYDRQENAQGGGILSFFTDKKTRDKYLFEEDDRDEDSTNVRRGDALMLAYNYLSRDVYTVIVGLGIGNVMASMFNEAESGKFATMGAEKLTLTHLFWESGLSGVITYLCIYLCIFRDVMLLKKRNDAFGTLALGWTSVFMIMVISLIYTNMGHQNVINFLFWYFSGLLLSVMSETEELRKDNAFHPHRPVSEPLNHRTVYRI
ncbi:hypothetical protein DENIS_1884 [Desulfonema ishimotonii]|uniref:O-antigen ligase domain-containing protein n=1 Tax=Desulfonema ishimotonii TaxID=45657 RepID=A0A401FVE9_9BACT|nr:hypothetical protein [Desulfonema ishimotonii]GBC60924.1 hypothetical protein DENIS_1884 [Desulfonema ishimotonii]